MFPAWQDVVGFSWESVILSELVFDSEQFKSPNTRQLENELLIERSDYVSSQGPLAIARSHWPGKDRCSHNPRKAQSAQRIITRVERRG